MGGQSFNSGVMFLTSTKALFAALIASLFIFGASAAFGQQQGRDACHVYIVDVAKSKRAFETVRRTGNEEADEKALSAGQTIFPEFRPAIGEEELTTKRGVRWLPADSSGILDSPRLVPDRSLMAE